ncbi:MAG: TonB-dependent receptor, partial [Bacteroidota bacterium]
MRQLLLLIILYFFVGNAHAQFGNFGGGPKIKGKISGTLIDSLTNEPISFASLSLRKTGKTKILNGALSEDDGKFVFTDVTPGEYDIEISFMGYATKLLSKVETTKKSPDNNVGTVLLASTDLLLEEVEITGKRELFENKVDRIVFNAEDDSSIAGGDATDVLRKVPNLSVDLDGNVSIRGSQNIRILINGKPSGMFSNNVADALKMFPADQIKKVEVITSPGAKYEAEGSGGIINIVTKKANIEGIAGTINASGGNRQNNAFVNLNAGKGRFGSTINGAVFYSVPLDGTFSFDRTDITPAGNRELTQFGINQTERLGFNGSASAFYDINAYNSFNTSFTTRGFGFDTDGVIDGSFLTPEAGQGFQFSRDQLTDNLVAGFDWNTDYTRTFEGNETQELVFAVQLSRNDQDQDNSVIEPNWVNSRLPAGVMSV